MKKYLFAIFLLFLTGCSNKVLPPLKKYTITPTLEVRKDFKGNDCKSLKITLPQSSNEIMTKNIIYIKGFEKNSYYLSKWYETPNQMLAKLFYNVLKQKQICQNIIYYNESFNSKYILKSDIIDFYQIVKEKKSFVKISVIFYLIDDNGQLLAQKEFTVTSPTYRTNAFSAVQAFNKASMKLSRDLVNWLAKTL